VTEPGPPLGFAFAGWARSMTDEHAFRREQARLGRCWTFLGLASDIAGDGDWFRTELGGRSIFVQRFGAAIRAFENRCAHRNFPLRTAERGQGPVVCGFHHWRYDEEGRAVGIPRCREMFGCTPRETDARLETVEIATCGSLVFGRFPGEDTGETLPECLGKGFPILESLCMLRAKPNRIDAEVAANWKLCVHITLDDYHIVAVHGRRSHHTNAQLRYFRFGRHSAHFVGNVDTLESMAADLRSARYRPVDYRIFNIFPNLAVSLFRATPYWCVHVQRFVPVAPGRSRIKGWFARTELGTEGQGLARRLLRLWPLTAPTHAEIVRYHIRKIGREDHEACARLQSVAHQIGGWPILGAQETRIAWFEEAYAEALAS
jgi:phenylpropionate dioxygenase-like ring-hydroxylating dioxygenase large terminal subunit